MNLFGIQRTSGDSELIDMHHDGERVRIVIRHGGTDKLVELLFQTRILYVAFRRELRATCYLDIAPLRDFLEVENGVYVPSRSFPEMMREVKEHAGLAYGLRVSQYGYLLRLIGSVDVAAVVNDVANIALNWID